MLFKINDIVMSAPGWRKGIFVITKIIPDNPVSKNKYNGTNLLTGKSYKLSDEGLASKRVGVADDSFLVQTNEHVTVPGISELTYENGRRRALLEARRASSDGSGYLAARWEKLASFKSGDALTVNVGRREETVKFQYVLANGMRYAFVAGRNGKNYKYELSVLDQEKRSENQIMEEIRNVYSDLSPEALSCDGEMPPHLIRKRQRELTARLAALQSELGRGVSETEAFEAELLKAKRNAFTAKEQK
jgi:hypothetical protein